MTIKQRIGRKLFANMPITRFLFDQLRVEANAAIAWVETSTMPRVRRRLKDIKSARGLLVNVACGPQAVDGFLNIDLFPARPDVLRWDCRRGRPLSEGSARGIKIEHFVEHLETREELPLVLNACHRALAPGGVLRIAVRDVDAQRGVEVHLANVNGKRLAPPAVLHPDTRLRHLTGRGRLRRGGENRGARDDQREGKDSGDCFSLHVSSFRWLMADG